MQNNRPNQPPPSSGINLGDIYYVIFRHKWMIMLFSLMGFGAAAGIYLKMAPPYQSEAKLMVRYVQDSKSLITSPDGETQVKQTDARGEGIISAEAEILTSLDIAGKVVDLIGVETILGKNSGETNRDVAAMLLRKNLNAEVPKRGNVLRITYTHPDHQVVQPVLRQIIDTYFKKHVEVHRALGVFDEFLQQQTDQVRASLATTEEKLRELKTKANVVSLEESKKVYADHFARLRQEVFNAEVELAERQATLKEMRRLAPTGSVPAAVAVAVAPEPGESQEDAQPAPPPKPPEEVLQGYKRLSDRLDIFRKREQDLLTQFTEENSLVKDVQASIRAVEADKKKLETDHPGLLESHKQEEQRKAVAKASPLPLPAQPAAPDFSSEIVRVTALTARIAELTKQFDKIKNEALAIDDNETAIVQLQRKKELEESQFRYYSSRLEEARLDAALGAGKISNISEIQAPAPPTRDVTKLKKMLAGASGGGIAAGLGLAFLLEMFLKQSVRRPTEITGNFRLPLFLTIPDFGRRFGRRRRLRGTNGHKQLTNGEAVNGHALVKVNGNGNGHAADLAPWDESHELFPFSEALRDRLVTFFEIKGMTHKPKLIAITSCDKGAGVTTIAAGLAASLSETGEGNVLLVDMNLDRGAAHPFYRGKPACGLEDVLAPDAEKRDAALVSEKLYMVDGNKADDRLPRILPKRIAYLLPKLHASDYDYIIFDMPPVTQTSVTPRIAGLMDMVLMVMEDSKTNREVAKQASGLLAETKANLGVVFNRRRTYVPRFIQQEF